MKRFIITSFCCASSMGYAQQMDSINTSINLDPVSIFNHLKTNIKPNTSSNFNHNDIFNSHQEIKLIKRSNYAIDPSFRANQYEQLNVQFDGGIKAMNACPNRMDPITTHLSMNQIQEVEVIKGPYSMRFGPNFGGIINLISHQLNDKYGFQANYISSFQSNPNAFTNQLKLSFNKEKWDVQAGYNYQDSKNYKDGDGIIVPSAYKSQDYFLKLGLKSNNKSRYEFGLQQQFGRNILHPTLPMDTSYDDTTIFHFIGKTKLKNSFVKEIQSKIYSSFVTHQMNNLNRPNSKMMRMITDVESTTIGGKIEAIWKLKKLNIYNGLDWIYIHRDGLKNSTMLMHDGHLITNPITKQSSVWQNTNQNNLGLFFQGDYHINSTNKFDFGFRIDKNELKINDPSILFQTYYSNLNPIDYNFSGTLSYTRNLTHNQKISLLFGRGIRSGDMIERTINLHQVGMDGASYFGNPNLKPEENYQFEIQYKKQNNKLHLDFSVYQSFIKNYIVAKQDFFMIDGNKQNLKQFTNIQNAIKVGFDLGWNYHFNSNYGLNGNLNYIYTKNKDWNEAIALTPPLENTIKFSFQNKWLNLNLEHQFVNHQNRIANSFGEKHSTSYHLMHFNSLIKLTDQIQLTFGIENLFDKFYQSHLNFNYKNQLDLPLMQRMANPGRNFKLQMKYNF